MRTAVLGLLAAASLAASAPAADPPKPADGWIDLLKMGSDTPWKNVDPGWVVTDAVALDPANNKRLKAEKKDGGPVWVNGEKGRLKDLITKQSFGDCEVHVEFLIAKGSNSGIKFHAVYEIQILDTHGTTKKLTGDSMGGIYPRAEEKPKYHHIDDGVPPMVNAAKPAGEWQTLDVVWKSPRFDDKGEKVANAVVVKALLNGQLVHENQELKTPTGGNWNKKENPTGPFMLQADHGPVAFRNVRIKSTGQK
jgi:hypothetical protein